MTKSQAVRTDKPGKQSYAHNELKDMEIPIETLRRAVRELTPDEYPDITATLYDLGLHCKEKATCACFREACDCFLGATQLSGSPHTRLESAQHYVSLLNEHPDLATDVSLLDAHSHVIRNLSELVWLGQGFERTLPRGYWDVGIGKAGYIVVTQPGAHLARDVVSMRL